MEKQTLPGRGIDKIMTIVSIGGIIGLTIFKTLGGDEKNINKQEVKTSKEIKLDKNSQDNGFVLADTTKGLGKIIVDKKQK